MLYVLFIWSKSKYRKHRWIFPFVVAVALKKKKSLSSWVQCVYTVTWFPRVFLFSPSLLCAKDIMYAFRLWWKCGWNLCELPAWSLHARRKETISFSFNNNRKKKSKTAKTTHGCDVYYGIACTVREKDYENAHFSQAFVFTRKVFVGSFYVQYVRFIRCVFSKCAK